MNLATPVIVCVGEQKCQRRSRSRRFGGSCGLESPANQTHRRSAGNDAISSSLTDGNRDGFDIGKSGGDSGPATPRTARVALGDTVSDVLNRRFARKLVVANSRIRPHPRVRAHASSNTRRGRTIHSPPCRACQGCGWIAERRGQCLAACWQSRWQAAIECVVARRKREHRGGFSRRQRFFSRNSSHAPASVLANRLPQRGGDQPCATLTSCGSRPGSTS